MPDSSLISKLKESAAKQRVSKHASPSDRRSYIRECRDNITGFREKFPIHWFEYIRASHRPPDYFDLLALKSWLRENGNQMTAEVLSLTHRLANQRLATCLCPRGVIVAALVLDKLYIGHSLCNFAAGDRWSRHIALWKAMKRIFVAEPCPVVSVSAAGKEAKLVLIDYSTANLVKWIEQFPDSAKKSAVKLTRRVLEQHLDTESITLADLLPVII